MLFPKLAGAGGRLRACTAAVCVLIVAGPSAAEQAAVRRYDRFQSVIGDHNRLVAVGAFGAVVWSADNGATWSRTDLPNAPDLVSAALCDDGTVLALAFGGGLWRGGKDRGSWEAIATPAKDVLLDLTCDTNNRIWVVGAHGALLGSADRGRTWTDKSLDEDLQFLNIQFPTALDGVVTGEFGRVMVTRDGGETWTEAGSLGPDFYPQGMHFRDSLHGTVVGLGGAVLDTADGGQTWVRSQAPTEAPLYGVRTDGSGNIVVVGAAGSAFVRTNGTWQGLAGAPRADLRGIALTPRGPLVAGTGFLGPMTPSAAPHGAK